MHLKRMALLSLLTLPLAAYAQQSEHPRAIEPAPLSPAITSTSTRGQYASFAGLARYAPANEQLGNPAAGVSRVVFMGDSITDTWGQHFDTAFSGKPYIGRGISGQTTPQMLLRFEQDVVHLHPSVVVILAGINDIAENTGPETDEQIEDNFKAMTALAKAAHIRVVLASILPATHFPWRPQLEPSVRVVRLNTWLRNFAVRSDLIYLDYYTAMATPEGALNPDLAQDKYVHPNEAGYAVMKPLAEAAINMALAQAAP